MFVTYTIEYQYAQPRLRDVNSTVSESVAVGDKYHKRLFHKRITSLEKFNIKNDSLFAIKEIARKVSVLFEKILNI